MENTTELQLHSLVTLVLLSETVGEFTRKCDQHAVSLSPPAEILFNFVKAYVTPEKVDFDKDNFGSTDRKVLFELLDPQSLDRSAFVQLVTREVPELGSDIVNSLTNHILYLKTCSSLRRLYEHHEGKISDKWESYLELYDSVLRPIKTNEVSLLEIGVQNGGSLEIWNKYFVNGKIFVGCDIDEKCSELDYQQDNISVVIGDAAAEATFKKVSAQCDHYDVIIDDGSHLSSDCIKNLRLYFDLVKPGGFYILEDLHCSYWKEFEGGLLDSKSIINRLKDYVDFPSYEFWGADPNNISEKERRIGDFIYKYRNIESISFYNSVVIIKKSELMISLAGKRVVVGSEGLVTGEGALASNGAEIRRR